MKINNIINENVISILHLHVIKSMSKTQYIKYKLAAHVIENKHQFPDI